MADITIYTRQFCGYCSAAKRLLDAKGMSYIEHDVTLAPDFRQEMLARSNGRTTFPQIFIDKFHVGGSDELHALERAGKLDPLLAGA